MKHTDKGHLGEAMAEAWLISKGYWVFKNRAPQWPIDIIAVHQKTGEVLFLDVKVASWQKDRFNKDGTNAIRSRIVSKKARELGVQLLYVNLTNCTCRIVKRRKDWVKKHGKEQLYTKEAFTKIGDD